MFPKELEQLNCYARRTLKECAAQPGHIARIVRSPDRAMRNQHT